MFQSARLKLTLWYVIIISIILVFFSLASYRGFALEVERTLQRQRVQYEQQQTILPDGSIAYITVPRPEDPTVLVEARQRILERILGIDLIILCLSTLAGYFLAGRTLKPIKKMVEAQNLFITDASHELRTPLTAARTSLEVGLRDKKLTPTEAHMLLESNLEDITQIQMLADNLLRLAQFENIQMKKTEFESVKLSTILTSASHRVASLAKQKKIIVTIAKTASMLYGNRDSLVELFVILIDNAIKYSKEGGKVQVAFKNLDNHVAIEVIDHGIGIDEQDLTHIFDRFFRADKSRTKSDASGYGLGLSIAKKITEEHHGSIKAESTPGKNTTFIVTLPQKK